MLETLSDVYLGAMTGPWRRSFGQLWTLPTGGPSQIASIPPAPGVHGYAESGPAPSTLAGSNRVVLQTRFHLGQLVGALQDGLVELLQFLRRWPHNDTCPCF